MFVSLPAYHKFSGFTLVEVLVVASVIGLLTGVGIASYNRFNERQRVQSAAMEFATELRVVQKRANAGEKPAGCDQLKNYTVQTFPSSDAYSVQAQCFLSGSTETKSLGANALFETAAAFTFYPLNRGMSGDSQVKIVDGGGMYPHLITAEVGGVITVEGP
jgi:prepilin-type N-terminal cleavage/methylation domain-containing protein